MATQESNPFEILPQDVIAEILLRLPVKSLLRYRCVSKSWLSHISSPEFETNYLEISTTRPRVICGSTTALYTCPLSHIFDKRDPSVDDAPLDFASQSPYDKIKIAGSCNGLVCLVFLMTGHIIVWNPATGKCRQLPSDLKINLCSPFGFGYDASSDDYKVVHIVHGSSTSYCRTYSLRNNSWKSSDLSHGMITFGVSGMFMNGAIHWIVRYNDKGGKVCSVVAQSLATGDILWSAALPSTNCNESRVNSPFLQVLGERLCVCFECDIYIEVWVMEEYGVEESWSKVFCLDVHDSMTEPLLVTEKGVVTTKTDSTSSIYISHKISLENREIIRLTKGCYVTATTYSESFVNPNFGPQIKRSCN